MAVASFGGPLALAALNAPSLVGDAGGSAGVATLAGLVAFTAPLIIWLRYARHISSAGGLTAFVEAAAGRRVALVQAGVWIVSYALYLLYTTIQIAYDLLPAVLPAERPYRAALALAIPLVLAAVMIAGRAATLIVLGAVAAGQLVLAAVLDGVTLAHLSVPASSLAVATPTGPVAKAGAQSALLYICGSLPLFLGGELARPAATVRRGLSGAYAATGLVVLLAVAPLAAAPGLARTDVPGVSVAQQFSGPALANTIAVGIAVSIAGVMLCEYLALTRLVHALSGWRVSRVSAAIGAALVLATPLTLIDPEGIYSALLTPSLVALWLSQLIVFAVYPRFARRARQSLRRAWALSAAASALAVYGLWTAVTSAAS